MSEPEFMPESLRCRSLFSGSGGSSAATVAGPRWRFRSARSIRRHWLPGIGLCLLTLPVFAQPVPDPMRPAAAAALPGPAATAASAVGGRLQSTLIGAAGARSRAIIDGRLVYEGDEVAGGRIVAIEPGRVRLRGPDGEHELRLSYSRTVQRKPN